MIILLGNRRVYVWTLEEIVHLMNQTGMQPGLRIPRYMRRSKMCGVLILLAFSLRTVAAQERAETATNSADQIELQRLERVWNNAHLHGDTAALDDLWADELVVTVPRMQVMNKAQSLAIWRTGRMKFQRYETSDTAFRIFGDAAVVTGRLMRERTFGDKSIHEDWRFTKVYVRRHGKWQVVSWQASESPPG